MNKFNLTAIASALLATGFSLSAAQVSAAECKVQAFNNTTGELNRCQMDVEPGYDQYGDHSELFKLNNSTIDINDSNISYIAKPLAAGPSKHYGVYEVFELSENSRLNIANSHLKLDDSGTDQDVNLIEGSKSNITIKNSTLTAVSNRPADVEKSVASLVALQNGSNAVIENSQLNTPTLGDLIAFFGENNTAVLNSVTANAVSGFGSWHADHEPRAGLKLTLNDSQINTKVLTLAGNPSPEEKLSFSEQFDISANRSDIRGITSADDSPDWQLNLSLNDSTWTFAKLNAKELDEELGDNPINASLSNLTLNNGQVNFDGSKGLQTLTIFENLSGNGNFTLNTDLANQQADKIVVKGKDEGNFGLNIQDSGNEPQAANGKVTLVETQTGTATFKLLNRDYVDAGAYRYRLRKDENNWVLSNQNGESANTPATEPTIKPVQPVQPAQSTVPSENSNSTIEPVEPIVQPTQPTAPVTPVVAPTQPQPTTLLKNLSERSNALVSLRQAQLVLAAQNLAGIHQRLGETATGEKGNVWLRNVNSRNEFSSTATAADSRSSGFEQDIHSIQFGADAAVTDHIRAGGFVGSSRSDVDFNGEYGAGKVNSQSVGIYGSYLADNGFYWDNVASYERLKAESPSTGTQRFNGYTLSSEIGRLHKIGNWTITPQLQAAWTSLSGAENVERLTARTFRAGVRTSYGFDFGNWKLQPYAELHAVNSRNSSNAVKVNGYRFDVAPSRSYIETAAGAAASAGNHRFGLQGSAAHGKRLDQPFKLQANYRYSW